VWRAGQKVADPLFSGGSRIVVSGRQWSLYFATLAAFEEVQSSLPTFVPAGGVGCLITLAIVQTSCFTRTHHRVLA
jgi:CHASE1-domain containing sensor protein